MDEKQALREAVIILRKFAVYLCKEAGKNDIYTDQFWDKLCATQGMLREFAYYHDTGKFLCEKKILGYSITDILIWQVDHFKAYLDRGDECLRYDSPRLIISAFEIMMEMDKDPTPYIKKLCNESGTDMPGAY